MTLMHIPLAEAGNLSCQIPCQCTVPLHSRDGRVQSSNRDELLRIETAGIKRRLQEMISPANYDDYSSSDTDTDSDYDSDDGCEEEPHPDLDGNFQTIIPHLVRYIKKAKAWEWIASAHYIPPPPDRLAPNNRTQNAKKRRCTVYLQDGDKSLTDVGLGPVDGYFHWACPFYKLDPKQYRECLQKFHFRSIEDVTSHLWRHHKQPPYCPVCFDTFDSAMTRDEHARSMTCKPRPLQFVDGVTISQRDRIRKRDKLYIPEQRRWLRIWNTLFPRFEPPESPFLDHGVEREICIMRDFWITHGLDMISEYLHDRNILGPEVSKRVSVISFLSRVVLDIIISTKVQEAPVRGADDENTRWNAPPNRSQPTTPTM